MAYPTGRQLISNGVFGMLIFAAAEAMFFAGLVSAFMIVRASAPAGIWPPPGQPRLPAAETAINTAALMLSGVMLWLAHRRFSHQGRRARFPMFLAIVLGVLFVALQGVEWLAMLSQGLTLTSSTHGSFFYLIVGMHGLHAVMALAALGWAWKKLVDEALEPQELWAIEVFWYFVVGLWPFIYFRVYF